MHKIPARETQALEFKKSLAEINGVLETISAFANNKGGKIFIGLEEKKDGTLKEICGISINGKEIENLANEVKQNTDPIIFPSITVNKIKGKQVLAIEIKENPVKPVFAKGKAFKRVGRTNQKLSTLEIREMVKESVNNYWDGRICEEARLNDINWKFIQEFFIPLYEELSGKKMFGKQKELLKTLGCIERNKPTNAGIILFGKNPQKFFSNAYIALAKYKGNEINTERSDYKEFAGNVFEQISRCNDYLIEHTAIMSRLIPGKIKRQDIPEYGIFSMRELITNSVCHRDYEEQRSKVIINFFNNKIEFYSIGGLPKGITPDNITQKQYSRNPIIARVLAKVKYIEEMGEGWNKIIKEHKEHPLKPKLPKIFADKFSMNVILFSTKKKFWQKEEDELNERQNKIVKYLKENRKITRSTCMKLLDISKDTAVRELSRLKSKNIIKRKGIGRGIYYVIK